MVVREGNSSQVTQLITQHFLVDMILNCQVTRNKCDTVFIIINYQYIYIFIYILIYNYWCVSIYFHTRTKILMRGE